MMKNLLLPVTLFVMSVPGFGQDAGWIGIRIADQQEQGVVVRDVEPDSPAARAGLETGDVIIQFNGQDVVGVRQFARLVRETPVGRTVEVRVHRGAQEQILQVTTERAPDVFRSFGRDLRDLPDRIIRQFPEFRMSVFRYGVRVDPLTPQLREYFGVPDDQGVLVASVEPASAAARAGLRAGDVITAVDGRRVSTTEDFIRRMRSPSDPVTLTIFRDRQEREIRLEGAAPRGAGLRGERISNSGANTL